MIRSLTWVPIRVQDEQLGLARTMAEALGLSIAWESHDHFAVSTERGDIIEYCGTSHDAPAYLFDGSACYGLLTEDLGRSAAALRGAGCEVLSPIVDAGPVRYQHFRGPGGVVALLQRV